MKSNAVTEEYKFLLQKIGENVSKARIKQGLTQRELGKAAEKNHTIVAKVEKFPPLDLSLRSIYELVRHIPASLSEIVTSAEKDLELYTLPKEPQTANRRMKLLIDKLSELEPAEQQWMADMIEGLLSRTGPSSKLTDTTDNRLQKTATLS